MNLLVRERDELDSTMVGNFMTMVGNGVFLGDLGSTVQQALDCIV